MSARGVAGGFSSAHKRHARAAGQDQVGHCRVWSHRDYATLKRCIRARHSLSHHEKNFAQWNRAAAALLGFSAEEALGQNLDLVIPEHLRAAHWRGFDAAMARGATRLDGRPTVTRAVHKSGRKLYVEMTFALVMVAGAPRGAVAVARDASERILRERAAAGPTNGSISG